MFDSTIANLNKLDWNKIGLTKQEIYKRYNALERKSISKGQIATWIHKRELIVSKYIYDKDMRKTTYYRPNWICIGDL